MKIDESKYPFKWMPRVANTFEGIDKSLSSFQIARAIGSCSPDASEVLKMMVYLTSFGKVVESDGKWQLMHIPDEIDIVSPRFRSNYLKGIDQVIKSLSNDLMSIEELLVINGQDRPEILKELGFLSQITKNGQIVMERKRFPQKFVFKAWE